MSRGTGSTPTWRGSRTAVFVISWFWQLVESFDDALVDDWGDDEALVAEAS